MHIGDEMEISKEREAFEAEFSKIKSDIAFWLHTWDEEMQGYNHPVMCWFWYMWQAKKQATPEGFVLLPREMTQEMVDSLHYGGYAWGDEEGTRNYFQGAYTRMINATQEQSHD